MEIDALSVDDLCGKISEMGFKDEANIFRMNEIDGSVLEYVTEEHLKEMGIGKIGPRVIIMDFIEQMISGTKTRPVSSANTRKDMNKTVPLKALPKVPAQQQRVQIANPKFGNSRPTTANPASTKPKPKLAEGEKPKYVRDHEKIVESMRAARKYAAYEKAVAEGRAVGPPPELPPIEEPEGLVQCPSCGRKMSEEAAKHHFPVCERTFSQGNMTKKRR